MFRRLTYEAKNPCLKKDFIWCVFIKTIVTDLDDITVVNTTKLPVEISDPPLHIKTKKLPQNLM